MSSIKIAQQLIADQFSEYSHLLITEVEKQGHDNRTYRLGEDMLIRMPTAECYALKVPKEQQLLPQLQHYLTYSMPAPLAIGKPTAYYPYPFSIYKYLPGRSLNLVNLNEDEQCELAVDLAKFLRELQSITNLDPLQPGEHNFWRGYHASAYDKNAREQIKQLNDVIDHNSAITLWERACATHWAKPSVWIHGDVAVGNILVDQNNCKMLGVIDFGGCAVGDPACDLVIAWTYFNDKSRDVFINSMKMDDDTLLRARAWTLWKATYELCKIDDKNSDHGLYQRRIINDVVGITYNSIGI
jgi:aminoglycoside phosphotransferase (APT) family kinase protein